MGSTDMLDPFVMVINVFQFVLQGISINTLFGRKGTKNKWNMQIKSKIL